LNIEYRKINNELLETISVEFDSGWITKFSGYGDDTFGLAAMDGDMPVGYVFVTSRTLMYPLEHITEAYIEIIEVTDEYQRLGIGQTLITRSEEWARKAGFRQIRTHSNNQRAVAAINMWNKLNYGLCPHDYYEYEPETDEYKNQFSGYWVAKVL